MKDPLLTAIVPVYNGDQFLAEALQSILSQDACPLEIVVVDDGSTDGTREVSLSFGDKVRYVYQTNSGPPAARNTGLANARGELIGFLDADDLWPEDKLARQLAALAQDDQIGMTLGMTRIFRLDGPLGDPRFLLQMGCGLYRRSTFERVGGFNPAFRLSDDVEWFTRAREANMRIHVTDDTGLHYRVHENNITWGTDVYDLGYLHIIKGSLDRRRSQADGHAADLPPL